MMKKKFLILVSLFSLISYSQIVGKIELKKGDEINMYAKEKELFSMHGQTIYYYNEKGKSKSLKHSKINKLTTINELYINLPIYSLGAKRLHRVVAENDKYLLTDYYSINRFQFYIFDKSTMDAVVKLQFQTYKPKKDKKLITIVEKYFGTCNELMNKIQSNFDAFYLHSDYKRIMQKTYEPRSILFENISSFKCD